VREPNESFAFVQEPQMPFGAADQPANCDLIEERFGCGLDHITDRSYRSLKVRFSAFTGLALLTGLVVVAAAATIRSSESDCTLLSAAGNVLKINLSDVASGTVRTFCYKDAAGQKLRFLLARDSNGALHAAFDACEQCYKFRKGYAYSDGYLICRVCGNRYRAKDMSVGKVSCVPAPLASKPVNGQVRIKVADVEAGKWLF
jgi:uncharacterized membrane protein